MAEVDEGVLLGALRSLPGVADAQLVAGNLQLDLTSDADEATVAAGVSRLLKDRFGLGIATPGEGSLAAVLQLRPAPAASEAAEFAVAPDPVPAAASRARLGRLRLVPAELGIEVQVELTWQEPREHQTVGTADGPATSDGVRRAVAEAALRAVNLEIGDAVRLDVAEFAVAAVGAHKVAIVRVTWSGVSGITSLTGASDVRDDVRAALVRAVLAATNRKLTEPI